MLQVVPGMSRVKAERLLHHFPYPRLLLDALSDPRLTEGEQRALLADKLDPKKSSVKLAAQLHKIFTSLDPLEAIL